jgi:DNA-binding response OmpR family regulator
MTALTLPPTGTRKKTPRLILGLGVSGLAAAVDAHFRTLGWDVGRAASAEEAAEMALRTRANAVVLTAEPLTESGVLSCAKLKIGRPATRIVLVGPEDARLARFARFAGAASYLPERTGAPAIVRAVLGN